MAKALVTAFLLATLTSQVEAQGTTAFKKGNFYFSWGYNKEWYTNSTIKVNQPSLGNHFAFVNVMASDKPGWDKGIFNQAISIPQYNYRVGYFFKDDWAFEINFDHTKYQVNENQLIHVKGTMDHKPVDTFMINGPNVLKYQLNNGANFFLFNLVHRKKIGAVAKNIDASVLLKGGVGFMVPHVQNTMFGKDNDAGFQFGGLDLGVEGTVRLTFFNHVYLEYCNKLVLTDYWGLSAYEGKAKQVFGTYEMILNLGGTLNLSKNHTEKKAVVLN
ncbi:hypothetical protein DXN05_08375 [Deminuibacter soli]|uniref:Outer membrane protein beta-barrel domain-containing protein n=2 Tax=Deminuibacter soli TaxID=2291815 RepID=A0A3E1NLJ4_9BACT|nr:hypothetical protein DXN05_08375 [Deminuibacter soli]